MHVMPPSPDTRTEAMTVRVTPDLLRRITEACKVLGVNRTEGINQAIVAWLERREAVDKNGGDG